jgi:hypothetical protein
VFGEHGNNFSSTQFVQHCIARAFKKAGKRLAVLAVANDPVRHIGRSNVAC